MAGKRQPTDVVVERGKKHLSEAEEDARRDSEIRIAPPAQIVPPKLLPKRYHEEFCEIAGILAENNLYTELDRDVLGQYFVTRGLWEKSCRQAEKAIRQKDQALAKDWTSTQAAYFKQCRQCAEVMGLSVSSRCRLVLPAGLMPAAGAGGGAAESEDEFTQKLRERQASAMSASE